MGRVRAGTGEETRESSFAAVEERFEFLEREVAIRHSPPARHVGNFVKVASVHGYRHHLFFSFGVPSSNSPLRSVCYRDWVYGDGISSCVMFCCGR